MRFPLAAWALVVLLAGCAAGGASEPLTQPLTPTPAGSDVVGSDEGRGLVEPEPLATPCEGSAASELVARDDAFDPQCLSAPAGTTFFVRLVNADDAQTHSFAIYDGKTPLFQGPNAVPETTETMSVPPISEGLYTFRCDIVPGMEGEFVLEEA